MTIDIKYLQQLLDSFSRDGLSSDANVIIELVEDDKETACNVFSTMCDTDKQEATIRIEKLRYVPSLDPDEF